MVDTGAGEPANKKAGNSADNTGVEPNWWFDEVFTAYYSVYNYSNKKSEWGNGGGHAKQYSDSKHVKSTKEWHSVGYGLPSDKLNVRNSKQ